MPRAAMRPCAQQGCSALVHLGYCQAHQKAVYAKGYKRTNPHRAMYNASWLRRRRLYLMDHPLCVDCDARGILTPATEVDHIKAHKGNRELFDDENNWQALCKPCHSYKTATQDGAFGRKTRGGGG